MLKTMAYVYAAVFILIAVAGYLNFMMKDELLLGLFALNNWHNHVHLMSGIFAGVAGYMGDAWSRLYFQVFGVIYGLVAILGMFHGPGLLLGYIANNWADVGLHVVLSGVALYLGFFASNYRAHRRKG